MNSPFNSSSFGTVGFLGSVTRTGINATTSFTYDASGGSETSHSIIRDDAGDASRPIHALANVVDNGATSSLFGMWNQAGAYRDSYWQAILLLHELGHVYNDLKGAGGSAIEYDGFDPSGSKSDSNTQKIIQDCFRSPKPPTAGV